MRRWLLRTGERGAWRAATLLVLFLFILARSAGDQAPARQHDTDSLRISVDVALVVLHATVADREGGLIHDLGEQDFEVFEDGVRQHIRLFRNEDIPVTVGLVIDHSSTMRQKLSDVSAAART